MAGEQNGRSGQLSQDRLDRIKELASVASEKVRAGHAADKQGVAGKQHPFGHKYHVVGSVSWCVASGDLRFTQVNLLTIFGFNADSNVIGFFVSHAFTVVEPGGDFASA